MKTKRSWLLAPAAIAIAAVYYSFFGPPPPPPGLGVSVDHNTNVATFTVSNLPDATGTGASNFIFLSHGDGTFFMGTPEELATHTHHYAYSTTPYQAFLEHVEIYDDKKKPPGRTAFQSATTYSAGSAPTPVNIPITSNHILLQRTTNPVPGDSITYVITYEHLPACSATQSGRIRFYYDSTVFSFVQRDNFFQEGTLTTTNSGATMIKEFTFSNLAPGEQRSFYMLLETKETVDTGKVLGPATKAELIYDSQDLGGCSEMPVCADSIAGERVLASHDPNYKTVIENDLCAGDSVTWRIDFQNTGNGPEDSVVVADWIDTLLEFNSVEVLDAKFAVSDTIRRAGSREVRMVMPNITLRGMGEPGVQEEDTRGYVVVRAKKRSISPKPYCSAVANAVRIFFGCNPPVFTETALASYPCADTCSATCSPSADTTFAPQPFSAVVPLIPPGSLNPDLEALLSGGTWAYKWYPATGLSDPFILSPTLLAPVNRTYTLVASRQTDCDQVFIRVPVRPAAPIPLTLKATPTAGCPYSPVWSVTGKVASADTANLVWSDCRATGHGTWTSLSSALVPQKYYVAVWDTLTDNIAEEWILLPLRCPDTTGGWGSLPPWVRYAIYVLGALAAFRLILYLFKPK